jgi:hypothetical protein
MNKDGKNGLMAGLVTLVLLFSMVVITTLPVSAGPVVFNWIDADSGICGQKITINASGFDTSEYVWVNFTTTAGDPNTWPDDDLKKVRAKSGMVNTSINIPWRSATGQYLINMTGVTSGNFTNQSFTITDIYKVETVPDVIYWDNAVSQEFTVNVYNWSGSSYVLHDESIRYIFYPPDFSDPVVNNTMNTGSIATDALFNWSEPVNGNREANYTLNITGTQSPFTVYAGIWVPVRFHMTDLTPTTATYGDSATLEGKLIDGGDDPVVGLNYVNVIAPSGNAWYDPVITTSTGRFTFAIDFNESGTWYIGTEVAGNYRPGDDETTKERPNFIWYETIEVSSAEGTITVDPVETVYGFNQTFEVYCEDQNGDPVDDGTHVNVTGIGCIFDGTGYPDDAYVGIGTTTNGWCNVTADKLKFNESGTATFLFTYDQTHAYYEAHEDEEALISAETTVLVSSPTSTNIFTDYDAEQVLLGELPYDPAGSPANPPTTDEEWGNWSSYLNVTVYGKTDSEKRNVSFEIVGCGLDMEFEEEEQPVDGYQLLISPRNEGVLTITVHNETNDITIVEDYEITGLASSASTSIGDDKEITVEIGETISYTATDVFYGEVHATFFDSDWVYVETFNDTVGDKTSGNGLNGIYEFIPPVDDLGHIVLAAQAGYGSNYYYTYDIVDIVPNHDLVVDITEPDQGNLTLTAGLEFDITVEITNLDGDEIEYADMGDVNGVNPVIGELLDYDGDVIGTPYEFDHVSGNVWELANWIPPENGTLRITANAFDGKHDGNNSDILVDWAIFEYYPPALTSGIGLEIISVEIAATDANGNPITETTFEMDQEDAADTNLAPNSTGALDLDEFGEATIWFTDIGQEIGSFCATLSEAPVVATSGNISITFPVFELDPATIYVGLVNDVTITARDMVGNLLEGVNLTVMPSVPGILNAIPDPVQTDSDGKATLTLAPQASGTLNVTIAYNLHYVGGQLNWSSLLTDTTITVTSKKPLTISVSKSPIFEGETLTVTVKSGADPISGADVNFGETTSYTDSDGKATFTAPDPGVDSAIYSITAEKEGYMSVEKSITVIKAYEITISGPSTDPGTGSTFTITVLAKGSALAGATVTFEGKTITSDENGKVTFTAPSAKGDYTVTATYEKYQDGVFVITIVDGAIPGFELLTLIAAIGVAFILLRRRRN